MTSPLLAQALRTDNTRIVRLSVYDRRGVLLTDNLPWTSGEVVENWETGARSTLTLELPGESSEFVFSGAEIRPQVGISLGTGSPVIEQLGCFPIEDYDESFGNPNGTQSLTLNDRWKWVVDAQFQRPKSSKVGMLVRDQIALLIMETGRFPTVTITATSTQTMTAQTWTGSRHDVIATLCKAIGAEVFVTRTGTVLLRNRPTPGASVFDYEDGEGGTRISWAKATATSQVINSVLFYSSWPDPAVPYFEARAAITDPFSPANPQKIGVRGTAFTDPNVSNLAGAKAAVQKYLSKVSAVAVQHSITCLPDVARLPADTITLIRDDGTEELAQIQSVSHPLSVDAAQQITTVNTRSDEDSGL